MNLIRSYLDDIFFAFIVLCFAILIARLLRFSIGRFVKAASRKLKVDPTKYNFLKNAVEFIVYIIAFIIIFNSIPKLRDYGTALFASAGVLAAIVGFASQSAFSNIVSGIFIVIFKPFSVGDRVKVGQTYQGDVEDITLRHTVIKDFENRRIVIPNSVISNETIINSTLIDERTCIFLELNISFASNPDVAMEIMREEALKHPLCCDYRTSDEKTSEVPQVDVRLIGFNELGMQLRAYVWARNPSEGFDIKCDLNRAVKQRFDQSGIEFATPQRTVLIKEGSTLHQKYEPTKD
jgi:small conductance mechanosensitive channel